MTQLPLWMGVLPLVSDGFFGRSGNPLPSILSFFSALLDAEVSIANASEKKESNTKAINGRAGEDVHGKERRGSVNLG